jgi:hypothetical protein
VANSELKLLGVIVVPDAHHGYTISLELHPEFRVERRSSQLELEHLLWVCGVLNSIQYHPNPALSLAGVLHPIANRRSINGTFLLIKHLNLSQSSKLTRPSLLHSTRPR